MQGLWSTIRRVLGQVTSHLHPHRPTGQPTLQTVDVAGCLLLLMVLQALEFTGTSGQGGVRVSHCLLGSVQRSAGDLASWEKLRKSPTVLDFRLQVCCACRQNWAESHKPRTLSQGRALHRSPESRLPPTIRVSLCLLL